MDMAHVGPTVKSHVSYMFTGFFTTFTHATRGVFFRLIHLIFMSLFTYLVQMRGQVAPERDVVAGSRRGNGWRRQFGESRARMHASCVICADLTRDGGR